MILNWYENHNDICDSNQGCLCCNVLVYGSLDDKLTTEPYQAKTTVSKGITQDDLIELELISERIPKTARNSPDLGKNDGQTSSMWNSTQTFYVSSRKSEQIALSVIMYPPLTCLSIKTDDEHKRNQHSNK